MGTNLKETLNGMQGLWDKSQAAYDTMFGGAKVPPNTYDAELTKCFIKTANSSGNPYIGREFTILEGEQEGAKVFDRIMLHNDTGPVFARKFIDQLGYEQPKQAADLEAIMKGAEERGLKFQIAVKHNGDFVNVTILKNLDEDDAGDGGEADTGAEGDNAPAGNDEAEAFRQSLLAFCRSQDIKVKDDDSTEDIVTEMKRYGFERDKLEESEVQLLTDAGLEDCIEEPAPATPPPKATPKPAAKAPAAPAKAPAPKPGAKPTASGPARKAR